MAVHLLQIELDLPFRRNEIPCLRGAIAERVGWDNDLFHNHRDGHSDRYHYRYPLVQYQCRHGRPVLLGLNTGAGSLRALLDPAEMRFCGDLPVAQWREECRPVTLTEHPQRYALTQWLALNADNYRRWETLRDDRAAQLKELERILTAHLLAFAEGVGFDVPRPRGLWVSLDEADDPRPARCHDTKLLSFDIVFRANMALPGGIGVGKSASHGFGVLRPAPSFFSPGKTRREAPATERVFQE